MLREFSTRLADDRPTALLAWLWRSPFVIDPWPSGGGLGRAALSADFADVAAKCPTPCRIAERGTIDRIRGLHLSAAEFALHALRIQKFPFLSTFLSAAHTQPS